MNATMIWNDPESDKATLSQHWLTSGGVYEQPILRRIIDAAPSPNAADEHIQQLGWSNDLARKVRAAVRAKKMASPQAWKELSVVASREGASWVHTYQLSSHTFMSTSYLFWGEDLSLANWPFLLRDFTRDREGVLYTTLDYDGTQAWTAVGKPGQLDTSAFSCQTMEFGIMLPLFPLGYREDMAIAQGRGISAFGNQGPALYCQIGPRFEVISRLVEVMPAPGEFPVFYKAGRVTREDDDCKESISVFLRCDRGPQPRGHFSLGRMTYRKIVRVLDHIEIELVIEYTIQDPCTLASAWPHIATNDVRLTETRLVNANRMSRAERAALLIKACTSSACIQAQSRLMADVGDLNMDLTPLGRIFGESLLTNPPESLLSLLCK